MRADRSCFNTTRNVDAKQKITIAHNINSRAKQSQPIVWMAMVFKLNQSDVSITINVTATAHDISIICITRRRFTKVKYFEGFATAMNRSSAIRYTSSLPMRTRTAILYSLLRRITKRVSRIHSPCRKRSVKKLKKVKLVPRRNQPLLMKRWRHSSSFEVTVSCRPWTWLIHFPPSSGLKVTSRESRTSFSFFS